MTNYDVNIDQVVDYKAEYSQMIKKHKVTGHSIHGLCPFHGDTNASFSADLITGQYNCFACGAGGNFTSFYAKLNNMDTKEAYKSILEKYGVNTDDHEQPRKEPEKEKVTTYTLQEYAFEKRIPEDWLVENCCLKTEKEKDGTGYIKIPYFNEANKEQVYRKRFSATHDPRFKWKYGSAGNLLLYGEWLLPKIRTAGYAIVPEGESDTQTLWYLNFPAIGIPGASLFKEEFCERLQDLKLYLHVEPDQGGKVFLEQTTKKLRDGGFIGEVYTWSCKQFGVKDPSALFIKFGVEDATKMIQKAIKQATLIDLEHLDEVIPEAVKGAPVNLRQPEGWIYSDKGISKINEKTFMPSVVCRTPIILTQRLKSVETGEEKIEIAFKRDGEWHTAIFPRSIIFQSRSITTLADLGCTITSENAKLVVRFLEALEAENIDIITKADSTSTFGWQSGKRFLPGIGKDLVLDIETSLRGWANAYCVQGTMEKWILNVAKHRERDKFRFILASSFAAPLLKILRQRIFIVYNWGGSKGGKTAALKAALSAWGDPERLMVNFNATQVALERMAGFYCDLPLGIDERQLAGQKQEQLEKIIYMLSSGTGRARGNKGGGLQAINSWRTVAMMTGEEPISGDTTMTGVSTRVLEIYGGPFDDEKEASLMHQTAGINCGWAGPAFIEKIMELHEDDIRDKYDELFTYIYNKSNGKNGSHVAGIAATALADCMIDTWFFSGSEVAAGLEFSDKTIERAQRMADRILNEQMSNTGDVNEHATQFLVDWILSNKDSFGERAFGTCLGMFQNGNAYIFPSMLNQALQKAGYSPRKTLKYLADNGLVTCSDKTDGGKQYSVIKWFANRSSRFVEFKLGQLCEEKDPLIDEEEIAESMKPEKEGWRQVNINEVPFKDEQKLPFE